jgi:hypothetical protein
MAADGSGWIKWYFRVQRKFG